MATAHQRANMVAICREAKRRGATHFEYGIALMVAWAESNCRVLANAGDPSSQNYPNDGIGYDHDSAGIFQQRPPWGPISDRMNPQGSARLFFNALDNVDTRSANHRCSWEAAQDVQVSAYDGNPRQANNWSNVYGGNYLAQRVHAFGWATYYWVRVRKP